MTVTPGVRKLALLAHVVSSVGWLGAVAGFLALAIAGLASDDPALVRGAYGAMEVTAWAVILPLALASLATGLVQSLVTRWGLFRHYWVVFKLLLTIFATVVLLLQLDGISSMADNTAEGTLSSGELRDARTSLLLHAGGGIVVLLAATALAVYKPRGITTYGRREPPRAA
jgi:hypothetical protein